MKRDERNITFIFNNSLQHVYIVLNPVIENLRQLQKVIKLKIALESKHAHHINIDNRSFKVYRIIFS